MCKDVHACYSACEEVRVQPARVLSSVWVAVMKLQLSGLVATAFTN